MKKQIIGIMLTLCMLLSVLPLTPIVAAAAENVGTQSTASATGAEVVSVKINGTANGGFNKYVVKVSGTASKVQVIFPNANTYTFNRNGSEAKNDNSRGVVSIKAYDKNNNEVTLGSADTSYELWVINMSLKEGTYTVRAKYKTTWEAKGKSLTVSYSTATFDEVKVTKVEGKNGSYSFKLDGTAQKIQVIHPNKMTNTFTKSNSSVSVKYYNSENAEVDMDSGEVAYEIWTISKKYNDGSYSVIAKYNNGSTYVWGTTALAFDIANGEVDITLDSDKLNALSAFTYEKSSDGKVKITGVKDTSVTELTVPDFVYEIAFGAFKDCKSLEKLTVPYAGNRSNGDYSSIGYAFGAKRFNQCADVLPATLTDITVTGGYSNDEELQSYTFYNCQNLKNIVIGDGVTYMNNGVFYDCIAMKSLTIPFVGAYKASVDDYVEYQLHWIFSDNTQFEGTEFDNLLRVPHKEYLQFKSSPWEWARNAADLGSLKNYFGYIPASLEEITVGGSYIPDSCFQGYPFKRIVLREGIEYIGNYAFSACTKLEEVVIPNSVNTIGYNLFNRNSYNEKLNESAVNGFVYLNDKILYRYIGTDTEVQIKEGIEMVAPCAFDGLENIEKVVCPSTLKKLGSDRYGYSDRCAFLNCPNLKTIELNEGLEYCNAVASCPAVENIEFPSTLIWCSYNSIPGAWYNKQPDGPIYVGKVLYEYKGEMPENTTITVREGTVGIADRAFDGQQNLSKVILPESLTYIERKAFYGCSNLADLVLPESLTGIGREAFYGCTSLTEITIPKNVTLIPSNCFFNSGIVRITFAEDTKLEALCPYAFRGTNLGVIQIPDSVKYIGSGVAFSEAEILISNPNVDFFFCKDASYVYFTGTREEAGALADVIPCYSEFEPPVDVKNQKYTYSAWYYDENGNITIWE